MLHITHYKSLLLAFVCSLLLSTVAQATHFRYGSISWRPISGNSIEFKIQQAWRSSAFLSETPSVGQTVVVDVLFSFGDGGSAAIPVTVTFVNEEEDWFFGQTILTHTYANAGNYTASFGSCCRISDLVNAGDEFYYVETDVVVGSNSSPVTTVQPFANVQEGQATVSIPVPANDPDGDKLQYRFPVVGEETEGINFNAFPNLSINENTGQISFGTNTFSDGQLYAIAVVVEDLSSNGSVKSKTMVDFIVRVVGNTDNETPPEFDYSVTPPNGTEFSVAPGQSVKFTVEASSDDADNDITLSALGIPPGATLSPTLPATSNPVSTDFNWTPTSADMGTSVINFVATYTSGLQQTTSVSITVGPQEPSNEVTGFTLVNADTDTDIQEIQDGDVIDIATMTDARFSITATTDPEEVGSLAFRLEGPFIHGHTENFAPYAIFGDKAGDYAGRIMPPGEYTLMATPYTESMGMGDAGTPLAISFTIVNSADIPDDFSITGFELYDVVGDYKLLDLTEGTVISLEDYARDEFTVVISTLPDFVGSIALELSGPVSVTRTENTKPYTLFRNNNSDLFGETFLAGDYTLKATPYTEANGQGQAGTPLEVNFSMIGENVAERLSSMKDQKRALKSNVSINAEQYTVYPVPFRDQFFIKTPVDVSTLDVMVYGLDGKAHAVAVSSEHDGLKISPQEQLPAGLYVLRILSDNQLIKSLKVSKQ